jgi:parallel beta-helix repeat protein/putative cofactor-binding repeat protein
MSARDPAPTPRVRLRPGTRWARRLAPLTFLGAVGVATALTLHHPGRQVPRVTGGHPPGAVRTFSHSYPTDPFASERQRVVGPDPVAPPRTTISSHLTITSLGSLAAALPRGTMVRQGKGDWMLSRPTAISNNAELTVTGPATLRIGPGAFLAAGQGGTILFRDLHVVGVDATGHPKPKPVRGRGFLVATVGGQLRLEHDRVVDLGFPGTLAYGVSFRRPRPGSGIFDSVVSGNYFGVYTSEARGVAVIGNRFAHSAIYGIDPHTFSRHVVIRNNVVVSSGVHGIILAQGVHDSVVSGNIVRGAGLHGIVLYDHSNGNRITNNRVNGTFDGIVVEDSSNNRILRDVVAGARRFALRMSGAAMSNLISLDTLSGALVGAYIYAGPTGNRLLDNLFAGDGEDIRIRLDAPGNVVSPAPTNSELRST